MIFMRRRAPPMWRKQCLTYLNQVPKPDSYNITTLRKTNAKKLEYDIHARARATYMAHRHLTPIEKATTACSQKIIASITSPAPPRWRMGLNIHAPARATHLAHRHLTHINEVPTPRSLNISALKYLCAGARHLSPPQLSQNISPIIKPVQIFMRRRVPP